MPYSAEYWHKRGELIRRIAETMHGSLDEDGRRLMRETADDCDRLAEGARRHDQAGKAIEALLDMPFSGGRR
jgi:hypothetical protein